MPEDILTKNKSDKKFKVVSIISLSFFLTVILICYYFPKLEFNKPEYNRAFGIFFNLYCFYTFYILLKLVLKLKNKALKVIAITLNVFFLLVTLLNFPLYLMKLDPQIQYYDVEIKYYNKTNKSDRIINQYYINWKSNQKIYRENRVYDIGPFRYFLERDIDTSKLNQEWEKSK